MKKEIAFAAAAAASLIAGSAFAADTASQNVNLAGTMAEVCTIGSPTTPTNVTNASLAGNTVSVTQLASAADASLLATNITMQLPVMCNSSFSMRIADSVSGLKQVTPTTVVGGDFTTKIGYKVGGQFPVSVLTGNNGSSQPRGAITRTVANNAADAPYESQSNIPHPVMANYSLTITIPADARPVVAGQYSGQIRVIANSSW